MKRIDFQNIWPSGRRWWLSGLLSYLLPGLGQIYNGQTFKGLIFYILYSLWGTVIFIVSLNTMKFDFPTIGVMFLFISLFIAFVFQVVVIVDAIRVVLKKRTQSLQKPFTHWGIYLLIIVLSYGLSYFAAYSVRDVFLRPWRVPTESMSPTIVPGDVIFANKLYYTRRIPQKGDVIFLQFQKDPETTYIKRIIAIPGDTLEIIDKGIYINGQKQADPNAVFNSDQIFPARLDVRDNFGPVIIPPYEYFVMGDNRDFSMDSRHLGNVKRIGIKGKAGIICLSRKKNFPFINLKRIGKRIN